MSTKTNDGPVASDTELLRHMVALLVELLPRHSSDCGVHYAHPSYGDKYCSCSLDEVREGARALVNKKP